MNKSKDVKTRTVKPQTDLNTMGMDKSSLLSALVDNYEPTRSQTDNSIQTAQP